jgi:Cys-tRNA(Pro)/Cys-tRNA(Cys) deacylase
MDPYEEKLKRFIEDNSIRCEHFHFEQSCHSVEDAVKASGALREDFIKSICMLDINGNLIVGIVKGEDKVNAKEIGKILGIRKPVIATPDVVQKKTGFPCGGTPPFGFEAVYLIDPRVMEKEVVWGGGGSERALTRIAPEEMRRANKGRIAKISR